MKPACLNATRDSGLVMVVEFTLRDGEGRLNDDECSDTGVPDSALD
jgi:hypothetical protein